MAYSDDRIVEIFSKTGGVCACCVKQIVLANYAGRGGTRGWWEVAHNIPKSKGGSDNLRNLWPMCFDCNRSMGAVDARKWCGSRS